MCQNSRQEDVLRPEYKHQIDLDNERSFLTFRNVYNGRSAKRKKVKPNTAVVLVGDYCLLKNSELLKRQSLLRVTDG
jgi:aminoglycoside phosphotransferase